MVDTTHEDDWLADDPLIVALRRLRPADDERFAPRGAAADVELARILAIDRSTADLGTAPSRTDGNTAPVRPASLGRLGPFDWSAHGPIAGEQLGSRSRPRRRVVAALAAAAVVTTAVVVPLTTTTPGPAARTRTVQHPGSPRTKHGGSARSGGHVAANGATFRLVDATSPFRVIGSGTESIQFDCVTETVCYEQSPEGAGPGALWQRTTDGGATWRPVAPLGGGEYPELTSSSCSSADVCAAVPGNAPVPGANFIALTTDGGATWSEEPVKVPSDIPDPSVAAVSCIDAQRCVVYVAEAQSTASSTPPGPSGTSSASTTTTTAPPSVPTGASGTSPTGTFLSTTDGGATWTPTSAAPQALTDGFPEMLRCAADGSCFALWLGHSRASGSSLVTIRSTDFGGTWTVEPTVPLGTGQGVVVMACGGTLHCLFALPSPAGSSSPVTVVTTDDGGATWNVALAPASWPDTAIAATCTGATCWLSLSNTNPPGGGGYADPVVEETQDNGTTWTSLTVPQSANGYPMGTVVALGCPDAEGCLAMGITQEGYAPPKPPASGSGDRATINAEMAAELANSHVLLSDLPVPTTPAHAES